MLELCQHYDVTLHRRSTSVLLHPTHPHACLAAMVDPGYTGSWSVGGINFHVIQVRRICAPESWQSRDLQQKRPSRYAMSWTFFLQKKQSTDGIHHTHGGSRTISSTRLQWQSPAAICVCLPHRCPLKLNVCFRRLVMWSPKKRKSIKPAKAEKVIFLMNNL